MNNDINKQDSKVFAIETEITQVKIELAQQEYRSSVISNGLVLNAQKIETENSLLMKIVKFIGITACVLMICLVVSRWMYPEEFCTTSDYVKDILYLALSLCVLYFFINEKSVMKKIASKVIPAIGNKTSNMIFKDIKGDYLPLIATYSFENEKVIYKRSVESSEKLVWEKPTLNCTYFQTENTVLIYNDTAIYPQYMLFVDVDNIQGLIGYFNRVGIDKLNI